MKAKLASQRARLATPNVGRPSSRCSAKSKNNRARFLRRGMAACQAEWKLLCGTHYAEHRIMLSSRQHAASALLRRP